MSESIDKLVDRYESIIETMQEKIDDLEEKLEKAEWWANAKAWSHPREEEESDLPVPRLQIKLTIISEWEYHWFYTMVYRHTLGHLVSVPMGGTTSHGGHAYFKFETKEDAHNAIPFGDGTHIRRDSYQLKLPAYAVHEGKSFLLDPIEKAWKG